MYSEILSEWEWALKEAGFKIETDFEKIANVNERLAIIELDVEDGETEYEDSGLASGNLNITSILKTGYKQGTDPKKERSKLRNALQEAFNLFGTQERENKRVKTEGFSFNIIGGSDKEQANTALFLSMNIKYSLV